LAGCLRGLGYTIEPWDADASVAHPTGGFLREQPKQGAGLFYGWWLVATLAVILFFVGGGGLYVFPVFIAPLQNEFGWSMTQISGAAAIWAIVFGFSGPLVGVLIARFGARSTMLAAALVAALGLLGLASLRNLTMLYLVMLASGFGTAGTTILPAQTLVTNWFDRYRGRAMGLTMLGIGAGGFLLPPFNEFLIRAWGWRLTWAFGCLVLGLIIVPLIVLVVRTKPSELGLLPDGALLGEGTGQEKATVVTGLPVRQAVATTSFWLLVGIYLFQLVGVSAMNFHFVPFATQQVQFTSQQAASFLGFTVGFSIVGRLFFGWLGDRLKPTLVMGLAALLLAAGPAVLELLIVRLGMRNVNLLWLYAVPYGTGVGGNAVVLPLLVGRCFGELQFSKILGLVMSGFALGIIVGIPLGGRIFDETGSYELVFVFCFVSAVISAVLALLIRLERHHAEFVTEAETGRS
jgi:MFS family permease